MLFFFLFLWHIGDKIPDQEAVIICGTGIFHRL